MLELNTRVRDDILGELRIFIQSRFLLRRRRRPRRHLRLFFCFFSYATKQQQPGSNRIRLRRAKYNGF